MGAYLWTRRPPPLEYIQYILCRHVYGCLPSQLDAEDWATIREHLAIMHTEAQVRKASRRR